jgi:hypothetical protein
VLKYLESIAWWLVQLPDIIAVFNTPPILAAVQKGAQL